MKLLYTFNHKIPSTGEIVELAIKKPTRKELDETDMVYSQFVSECVQRGILTREMMAKVIKNFGGTMSDDEAKEYYRLMECFVEASKKLESAKSKKEKETLNKERVLYFTAIQEIESDQDQIFNRTADVIARNKTIMFLVLMLGLKKDGEVYVPLYKGQDFEEKYDFFTELEEANHDDTHSILDHLILLVAYWYFGDKDLNEDSMRAYDSLCEYFIEIKSGGPETP